MSPGQFGATLMDQTIRTDHGKQAAAEGAQAARVAQAMATLPDRQRTAIALCHYEGLTNIEAAAILDVTVGALESLLVRARKALRTALADLAPEGQRQ